jgi:hypothetical protein
VSTEPTRLDPVEGILAVLDQGRTTATSKLGLLLCLFDLAPEMRLDGELPLRTLAERHIALHWDHPRPFGHHVLRQVTSGNRDNTTLVLEVARLRSELPVGLENRPFDLVRHHLSQVGWDRAVAEVGKDLWRNPVARLQNLPGEPPPFLYTVADGPKRLGFLDGVVDALVRFCPILRTLVEQRFADFVARTNRSVVGTPPAASVHEHLFGAGRLMPDQVLRARLVELQGGRCLWSEQPLGRARGTPVDHVIPWSRQRLSVLENLAMTTPPVNSSKSNLLLGPRMVERWAGHLAAEGPALRRLAEEHGWGSDLGRALRTARSHYAAALPSFGVWDGLDVGVRPLGEGGRARVLSLLAELQS